jgi:hypothetical protein
MYNSSQEKNYVHKLYLLEKKLCTSDQGFLPSVTVRYTALTIATAGVR